MKLSEALAQPKPDFGKGRNFRFIDLFAGIGGMRIPFDELGGHCVFSSEWDKFAQRTYERNFGHLPEGDISQISAKKIGAHDLLLAGFPCQAFSNAGLKQGFMDTRGTMFFEIQRILAEHRPAMFLLENVKQLRGHDKGRTLETILSILRGDSDVAVPDEIPMSLEARKSLSKRLDYSVGFKVIGATEFGVPQNRERIYIVGFDRSQFGEVDFDTFFDGLEGREDVSLLAHALEPQGSNSVTGYTISDRLWDGLQRRMARHEAKGNGFGHKVFSHDAPYCNTITSRYYKDGREILIDQSTLGRNPRRLTPRECARIQGFPEWFELDACSDTQLYRQFGNSVSVPVIRALAQAMVSQLGKAQAITDQTALG
ncbi:DNA (cytosine-5-)-methyltransferase [Sphingomicrobium aestuariivivum]|uniref:DNA (cytosine-5-)-methyltransferase n=1 Tax=Sphingomicrobium aestuariivivum TaxID=1582356 RepID=UPI001FD65121|nr:DNA (cytosine-5-)-methyltransferase [Sphingomicrobium aestuariivivum]MCJ8191381.1 DNA (cytosine-5-)-methyltransferase [Sphingomicrobium aestuariivivum]